MTLPSSSGPGCRVLPTPIHSKVPDNPHDRWTQPENEKTNSDESPPPPVPKPRKTWLFWALFPALCMTTFLAALETSILSTALPTIVLDFHASESAIAGSANTTPAIIDGRAVQGMGGGGINILVDTVICDLVPLRQRGKYVALMASVRAVGTTIGPVLGGAFAQHASWRWVFYINSPLCGVSLYLLVLFLRVNHPPRPPNTTLGQQFGRVDLLGNTILTLAVVAILLALTWTGTAYPWSSWRILTPLFLGLAGLALFCIHQASRLCRDPSIPPQLFSSATALLAYFLPVYFQALRSLATTAFGLAVLPITAAIAPFGVITGVLIAMKNKYRPFHFLGYVCVTIGVALFSLLDNNSPARDWAGFQAVLPESEVATATATWAFVRSPGCIWGIAIPTSIFNTRVQQMLSVVSDGPLRRSLANGDAYALAAEGLIKSLQGQAELQREVLRLYEDGLRWVWLMAVPFGVIGFLLCFPVREVKLREQLVTEFRLQG
ncbi:putative MFS transporter [Aspergillus japonicus CBS 114.51]|uniref:Putative MFS transporter n=1 Tax=Aspergillus japonicus CBS 114.51 TaxID=1448312 RepID=A0A8T8WJH2_ASPJA|nr:putative MFS transporter [Aspergillus japonicus CBS 114.51]RAH75887.1 putative MFS transporter [Aspergillus japonicus CBS 114.51]